MTMLSFSANSATYSIYILFLDKLINMRDYSKLQDKELPVKLKSSDGDSNATCGRQ